MMPSFIFIFKIRRTDSLRRSSVISPVSTALMTAGTCTSKSVQHSISFPACTALTAISASPANCRTPSMTRSSVMITPSNPNSLRKILCTGREIDAVPDHPCRRQHCGLPAPYPPLHRCLPETAENQNLQTSLWDVHHKRSQYACPSCCHILEML